MEEVLVGKLFYTSSGLPRSSLNSLRTLRRNRINVSLRRSADLCVYVSVCLSVVSKLHAIIEWPIFQVLIVQVNFNYCTTFVDVAHCVLFGLCISIHPALKNLLQGFTIER